MTPAWLALPALALAALPAGLTLANLRFFTRAPRPAPGTPPPGVSVLVPARDEAKVIGRLAAAVLANRDVDLELVVLDDDSRDETARIITALAAEDPRVRLVRGQPLPAGWCGKQHACWQLAQAARHDILLFLDADVTLEPDAVARTVAFLDTRGIDLASGFPRQETGCLLDWLLLPLIHFVLLGYLPLAIARSDNRPGLAAGCGQLFVTRREAYLRSGGHAAIKASLHDGIKLPRAYRAAGLSTDLFDAGDLARCRMYGTNREVVRGLGKNATEGIAAPGSIVPFTILLAGGQILPVLLLIRGLADGWAGWPAWGVAATLAAVVAAWLPRGLAVNRFGHSLSSALAHPLGIAVFLVLQWSALIRRTLGLQTSWRGRTLSPQ
jgi:Glycosyl transferase family 2